MRADVQKDRNDEFISRSSQLWELFWNHVYQCEENVTFKIMIFLGRTVERFFLDKYGRFGRNALRLLQSQSSVLNVQAVGSSETFGTPLTNYVA